MATTTDCVMSRSLCLVASLASLSCWAPAGLSQPLSAGNIAVGGDPRVNPLQFRVTKFASGLNFPYSMQLLDDGSVLVGTSRPTGTLPSFYSSVGEILRLVDANHDGIADDVGTIVYTGLKGPITSVRRVGQLLFVVSNTQIFVLRPGATPSSQYTLVDSINFVDSGDWEHSTFTLATRPTPNLTGSYDVFFNRGSRYNSDPNTATVSVSGFLSGTLNEASIYTFTVSNTGGTPVFSGLKQIASGLRNAAGMIFHPVTGDLYFEDNGIDGLLISDEPLSADELNRIAAGDIGASVPDFGFPIDYVNYRTGIPATGKAVQPLAAFHPIVDPFTGIPSESEGPAEIAFAPPGFPNGLNNGIFVGFHGRAISPAVQNEENPLVYYDLATGKYFHFIDNDQSVGHPDSLLSTSDSLFVADMSSTGELVTPGTGAIYQIQALPTAAQSGPPAPSTISVTPSGSIGSTANFSFVYSDANGFSQLNGAKMMFSTSGLGANSCLVYFNRAANTAFLTDDTGWNWQGPVTLGAAGSLQNGQCSLDTGASSASGTGTNLTVNLALSFKFAFQGVKNIYMWAIDNQGVESTWQSRGSWTVPGPTSNPLPTTDSVTPSSGSGLNQIFTAVFSDGNGYGELDTVYLLFSPTVASANVCQVVYSRRTNLLYLTNDAGSGTVGPIYPGATTIQNSQCLLDGARSQVTVSGNSLTLAVMVNFSASFTGGAKNIFGRAMDLNGNDSGWKVLGSWTAPCTYSVSPATENFPAGGGTGSISVTAGAGCTWSATSNSPWITLTAGTTGTGNGSIAFTVVSNTGVRRTGGISITSSSQ